MKCPNCQNKLHIFKVKGTQFHCDACKSSLKVENYTSVMNWSYLAWGLVISVFVGGAGNSFLGFIMGTMAGAVIHFFITPLFLHIVEFLPESETKDSSNQW